MKILSVTMVIVAAMLASAFGQEKTGEKKWTIDPETGDTIYVESVIISETEDITPRNSMIIINPLKFLLFYNISYFHKISDGAAIGGGIQFPTQKVSADLVQTWKRGFILPGKIYVDFILHRTSHTTA